MEQERGRLNFGELPEGCIAKVLSLTTPVDACRLSVVSPALRSAADSDTVWNEFMPPDIVSIVSKSHDACNLLSLTSKKQLFFSLCSNPILIDGETKSFWLDKWSGKKCYMVAARDLIIVWGSTPTYWSWISVPDSRFKEVARLKHVWWLEIRGKIDACLLSPATAYTAYLVFKLGADARFLGSYPSEVCVGLIGCTMNKSVVCLDPQLASLTRRRALRSWFRRPDENDPMLGLKRPSRRNDGWFEIELGEYFSGTGEEEGEVLEMSLMEVNSCPKSGLIVQGIEIRPKAG